MRLKKFLGFAMLVLVTLAILILLSAAIATTYLKRQVRSAQQLDRVLAAPQTGSFVEAGDTRVFVQRLGNADAPALLFIHGTGSWSETWRASMEHAVKLGYQAFAIDLPPFGYSLLPASGDYSKPKQAQRLLAALNSLGVQRATFVAHSFGAAPVMEALMMQPARAASVVLVDGALGLDGAQTDGADSGLQSVLRRQEVSELISAVFLTNPDFTQTLLRSFISEKDKATSDWVSLYQQPLSLSGTYRNVALWLPELLSRRGHAKSDDVDAYARLPFPLTLIWGETDAITPMSQALHLQALKPGTKLIRIPQAGHIPQIEEPQKFQAALSVALTQK